MSKYSGRGLLASFENEEDTVDAAPMVEEADNAEAALADAAEVQADINEAESVVDQAVEDSETLETVASQLESREQSGGATPEEAEMAEITVESICNRLGISRNPMQSMESFSSRSSRVRATRLSVEGIREVGDTIWKYIVKIYKKIKEWVLKAWDYLFDARTKLLRRAKALEAHVDKVEGTPKESVIQGNFVQALTSGNSFVGVKTTANLKTNVDKINKVAEIRIGDGISKVIDDINKGSASGGDLGDHVNGTLEEITGALSKDVKESVAKAKSNKEYATIFEAPLGNDIPVMISTNIGDDRTRKEYYKVMQKVKVEVVKQTDKFNKDFKAPVLSENDMSKALTDVISALEDLEDTNKNIGKFRTELDKAIKKLESVGQTPVSNKETKELNKEAKDMMKALGAVPRISSGVMTKGVKVILDYCRSVMDYVQKSAAQYKADEDDED